MSAQPTVSAASPASSAPENAATHPIQPHAPRTYLTSRAKSVSAVDGDIVAVDEQGHEARLTDAGSDMQPALSPDGKSVAFIRNLTENQESGPRALYVASVSTGEPDLLAGPGYTPPEDLPCNARIWMTAPEFSLDGARVFFSVMNGRLGATCAVALADKKVTWIMTAVESELLRKGPYKGHFFAAKREHLTLDGPEIESCYVIHSTTGAKLRKIPCDDGAGGANLQNEAARAALGLRK